MKFLRDIDDADPSIRSGAVSIGNFDGVHLGHARIVASLLDYAERIGGPSIIFTFDPHPLSLLRPDTMPAPLTTSEQKAEILSGLGVDAVIAYPTDRALLALSAEEFFQRIVRDQLDAQAIVEGPDFAFGRGRSGTIEKLRGLCQRDGIPLHVENALRHGEDTVSSSRIRQLLNEGNVERAAQLIGRPYRMCGTVVRGAGRGARIGFPTANLSEIATLLPAPGVYAGRAFCGQQPWPAAINLGPNPTFQDLRLKVEVHLIGCDEDMYEKHLEVDFLKRLRDIQKFDGPDALRAQLSEDIRAACAAVES